MDEQPIQPLLTEVHPHRLQTLPIQQWNIPSNQGNTNIFPIVIVFTIILLLAGVGVITYLVFKEFNDENYYGAEGEMVPNFSGDAHDNGHWNDFELYDYLNNNQFILIQFIDTDCPHCWNDAESMSDNYAQFGANGDVMFITVASGMLATDHSRAEIVAFQEKGDFVGCNRDNNCADRSGYVHNWLYVDDLDMQIFNVYNPPGVPVHLLLSPDGILIWNSANHDQGDPLHELSDALSYFVNE